MARDAIGRLREGKGRAQTDGGGFECQAEVYDSGLVARELTRRREVQAARGLNSHMIPGFYNYLHCGRDGVIYYVGKGHGGRVRQMSGRSAEHLAAVARHGLQTIVIPCASEEQAFANEIQLIAQLRHAGVGLCNKTHGGEGASLSPEARDAQQVRKRISIITPQLIADRAYMAPEKIAERAAQHAARIEAAQGQAAKQAEAVAAKQAEAVAAKQAEAVAAKQAEAVAAKQAEAVAAKQAEAVAAKQAEAVAAKQAEAVAAKQAEAVAGAWAQPLIIIAVLLLFINIWQERQINTAKIGAQAAEQMKAIEKPAAAAVRKQARITSIQAEYDREISAARIEYRSAISIIQLKIRRQLGVAQISGRGYIIAHAETEEHRAQLKLNRAFLRAGDAKMLREGGFSEAEITAHFASKKAAQ